MMMFRSKIFNDKYLSLLDQAFLSVVNFGSTFVILNFAEIPVVGSFIVTYSYSVAVYFIISLLISAPILVFFSKKYKLFARQYFTSSILFTLVLNLLAAVLLFYFLEKQVEGVNFLQFYLLCLGITLFDVLKKFAFSIKGKLLRNGLFSTIVLNILFFGLLLVFMNNLSLDRILLIYNTSFLTANLLLIFFILKNRIFKIENDEASFGGKFSKRIMQVHFQYSKWLLLGGLAFWGYSQGIYILAKYYGVSDLMIGKVRSIQNLLGVFNILLISLDNHYMPLFSKEAFSHNLLSVRNSLKGIYKENYKRILILFFLSVPIGLLVYEFVYAEKYGSGINIFIAFVFVQFLLVCARPLAIALKSVEHTMPDFWANLFAVVTMFLVLAGLARYTNQNALVISFVSANIVYALFMFVFYKMKMYKSLN